MNTRKEKLLSTLRNKLLLKERGRKLVKTESDSDVEDAQGATRKCSLLKGNLNALNTTQKIELGWLKFNEKTGVYSQVRKKHGGVTRKIDIEKCATYKEILDSSKSIFFAKEFFENPNINFELRDFAERKIEYPDTVADMCKKTVMSILRFYVATKENKSSCTESLSDDSDLAPFVQAANSG